MAISKLAVALSNIFLLLATAAAHDNSVHCREGGSAGCVEAVARSLINDVKDKVSAEPTKNYCNVLTMPSGQQIFGYGYCATSGRTDDPNAACSSCMDSAGRDMVSQCWSTGGAGQVWGPTSLCYLLVGPDNCASMVKQ